MDQTFFQSSTERTSSVASGDGSPTNFYFDDLMFNNSDMGLVATLVPPALLTQPLQQMLEQQFAASSLDMSRELQRQQQQHQMQQWMYDKSRQQQSSITLQPPEQHQENVVCAPQLHQHPSTMTTLHDEHSSRTPSPTIHVLDSLQLAPPTTQPLQSLPQYVFQEVTSSLVSMDHWRHRSSPQESPTTPDSIWAVTDSYFPSNLAPEARSLSPTVGFTSVEDLCLSRLDVSGSTTATTTHAGYECTIATGQQYMQTSATTSSYQESQQLDPFTDSESEESIMPAKKKRVRRLSRGTSGRSQTPQVKLKCTHPNCNVTCSSYPSLERHQQSHKWRGIYAPVRCEACQRDLSNEYSVQRHIRRSQPTSRCRRMRVYSVMRSRTEVETTVRFHPKRPHGKKTVAIDLAYARAKYFNTPINK